MIKHVGCVACAWGVLCLGAGRAWADEKVYQQLLPGTVWVITPTSFGKANTGSGALIDLEKKWVVTNYHVVEDQADVLVCFPTQESGQVVSQRTYYAKHIDKLGIRGRVIARDARRDLAIIALEKLPAGAKAVPLAAKSASPGQNIHSIGNPATSPALWVYTSGTVRQIVPDKWKAQGGGKIFEFDAWVLLTQNAVNPGDSGGPVVNDKGELVALVSSTGPGQLNNKCIDLREVKIILDSAVNPPVTGPIDRVNNLRPDAVLLVQPPRQVNNIGAAPHNPLPDRPRDPIR